MTTDEIKPKWKQRLKVAAQLVAVLLVSAFLLMSNQQRSAVAQVLRDPLSMLAARSPGERGDAALRQTKIKRGAMIPAAFEKLLDKEHVSSPVATAAASPDVFSGQDELPAVADFVPGTHDGAHQGLPDGAPILAHGGGGYFQIVPGGGPVGGGGGSGGGGGETCTDPAKCGTPTGEPTPPPVLVAVPEPGTWLMIIAGFFSLGAILRFVPLSKIKASPRNGARPPRTF
ncbi:MAG TPA: hypothetical protein VGE65_02100 [Sphingobium sp.]